MPPRGVAASKVVSDFPPEYRVAADPQAEAHLEVAKALNRLADVGEALTTALTPAAETVHGFGARMDALCTWLGGKWPWITLMATILIIQTFARAPEEGPKLITALAELAKAVL